MQDIKESINLMDHDSYKKEWGKLQEIRGKIGDAEVEYQHMIAEGVLEAVKKERELRVIAVLAGKDPDSVDIAETYKANVSKARKRITMFIEASQRQEKILDSARFEVSKKIAKEAKPKYEAIIKDMCTKWCELGELLIKERDLRESLNDNNVAYSAEFTPMVIYGVGDPRVYNSRFSGWLIEAVERNYFKSADIPKEFKDAWLKRDGIKL